MLISDSISLLWLSYAVLSLVVLVTGYLGLAFLSRLPRLVITWAVAGVMWMPASFSLPLLEEGAFYQGLAPAVVVAGLAFLEGNAAALAPAALLVGLGIFLGALAGLLLWRRTPRGTPPPREQARATGATRRDTSSSDDTAPASRRHGGDGQRREPVIG